MDPVAHFDQHRAWNHEWLGGRLDQVPTRSVVRSTVDSLTTSPASFGSVFRAASAKLDSVPARATASVAPRLRSTLVSPNAASRGQCPACALVESFK